MIVVDPALRFGRPSVGGVSTVDVAGMVMGGTGVAETAAEYGLTRHQVLLACWHEGLQGVYQREWKAWAEQVHPTLAGWTRLAGRDKPANVNGTPDPPAR
ncbi:hypothetical protein AB0L22_09430 [Micromonospora haikouensis]|uniref:DUF433 domain-containing protein n=1 Tax=Micromonospora haikouensis TaxID=686309 RepID=UPI00342D12FF